MATPFDMIGTKELAPTCTALTAAGGTDEHAAWLRKPGNAAAMIAFINKQMGGVKTLHVELYENERGTSNYGPPKGWGPKAHDMQRGLLREIWSGLEAPPSAEALLMPYATTSEGKGYRESGAPSIVLPDSAEGFFFQAKFSAILRLVKGNKGMADYNRVLKHLFAMMKERRSNFRDWTDGNIGPDYERPLEAWWKRRLEYESTIQGDFVAYAGQTGIAHRNWSVRAARAFMEQGRRWVGTASPDGCQILFLHEDRLTEYDHLGMDCAGSERAPKADGDFCCASAFLFNDGKLYFCSDGVQGQDPRFGSASLCLPGVA